MKYQSFYQLTGTLIATLLVALVVTGRFLIGSRAGETPHGWLVTYRRVVALVGLLAATYGESQVLKALLSSSSVSLVTPASAGLSVLLAALLASLLAEAFESSRLAALETLRKRATALTIITALSAIGGAYWIFYVRR